MKRAALLRAAEGVPYVTTLHTLHTLQSSGRGATVDALTGAVKEP